MRGKKRKETICCAYRDNSIMDDQIRIHRAARADVRVRLGDAVTIRPEPNVKYASSLRVTPFEDTMPDAKGLDLKEDFLLPYFEGKFRPVRTRRCSPAPPE